MTLQASKTLAHKNEGLLIRSGHDLKLMNQTTNLIAVETRDDHRVSVSVLKATKEDSDKVKIISYVAMAYLPASLVAVRVTTELPPWFAKYANMPLVHIQF
jgi:hypothetical protein